METIVVCVLPAMITAHGNIARSTIGPSPVIAVTVHVHSCVSNLTEAVFVVRRSLMAMSDTRARWK